MSWEASAWAKKQRLGSPSAKSIIMCLADYADPEEAACWPSQPVLAADAEVSERTVREWLQRLEEWGLIARERRSRRNGARASDRIVLKLDVTVLDGDERCRRMKDGEADENGGLPANSAGRTYRQPDTEPTGNGAQPTGNQFRASKEEPPIEPPMEPLTKGAQAREKEGDSGSGEEEKPVENGKAEARAFEKAFRDWPTSISDSRPEAWKAWLELSPEERGAAAAEAGRYVEACRAAGRKHVCSHGVYLREKRWTGLGPKPDVKPAALDAKAFGPLWQAARMKQLLAGVQRVPAGLTATQRALVEMGKADEAELQREQQARSGWPTVNAMHERAEFGRGVSAAPSLEPLAALMEPVPVGSERFEEWKLEHRLRGWPWLPETGRQPVVYFPAGGPAAGLAAFAAAVRGEGGERHLGRSPQARPGVGPDGPASRSERSDSEGQATNEAAE